MTKFIVDKTEITKKVLSIINPDYTVEDLDFSLKKWWRNIRTSGGLLLTLVGHDSFSIAGIEHYEIISKIEKSASISKFYLKLDRYMPCPYYIFINTKKETVIKLYDSRVFVLINLHGGFTNYINSLDIKRSDLTN